MQQVHDLADSSETLLLLGLLLGEDATAAVLPCLIPFPFPRSIHRVRQLVTPREEITSDGG